MVKVIGLKQKWNGVACRQVFSSFAVMHVCFIGICFYLEGFNFVCSYACFLLQVNWFHWI